jgi:hypothetical protein
VTATCVFRDCHPCPRQLPIRDVIRKPTRRILWSHLARGGVRSEVHAKNHTPQERDLATLARSRRSTKPCFDLFERRTPKATQQPTLSTQASFPNGRDHLLGIAHESKMNATYRTFDLDTTCGKRELEPPHVPEEHPKPFESLHVDSDKVHRSDFSKLKLTYRKRTTQFCVSERLDRHLPD